MKTMLALAIVTLSACGGPPPQAEEETESALTGFYQTGPAAFGATGVTKAESTYKYTCDGWTYRMLFNWEQHPEPAGGTSNWYVKLGPASSPTNTGTVYDGVSADVYLSCNGGAHPAISGVTSGGLSFNGDRLYADLSNLFQPISCTLTTVWPSSWGLPNPVVTVEMNAYEYVSSPASASANGIFSIGLTRPPAWGGAPPGYGWCGSSWYSGTVTTTSRLPLPVPAPMPPQPMGPCVSCL